MENVRFYILLDATQASKPAELLSIYVDICALLSRYHNYLLASRHENGIPKALSAYFPCVQITRQLFKLNIVLLTVSESAGARHGLFISWGV